MPLRNIEFFVIETGMAQRTIKKRLENLKPVEEGGPGRGNLYQSDEAWPMIFGAQAKVARDSKGTPLIERKMIAECEERESKTRLNVIEEETLQKTRIPIEIVNNTIDDAFAEIRAIIKSSPLPEEAKKLIFDELSDVPKRLKW